MYEIERIKDFKTSNIKKPDTNNLEGIKVSVRFKFVNSGIFLKNKNPSPN